MALQRSFVKMKGTLDDLTFFERKGKHYIRRKGTLDKDRIMKDKQFARTRENMSEFRAAANVSKAFRDLFISLLNQLGGSTTHARLTGKFRKALSNGDGKPGQRDINLGPNLFLFDKFEFNEDKAFSNVFGAFYNRPTIDENRSVVSWTVPVFDIENELTVPVGTTHYRFAMATVIVSDHKFNEQANAYYAITHEDFIQKAVAFSPYLEANEAPTAPIPLQTDMGFEEPLPATASSFTVVGVLFYKQVNGE